MKRETCCDRVALEEKLRMAPDILLKNEEWNCRRCYSMLKNFTKALLKATRREWLLSSGDEAKLNYCRSCDRRDFRTFPNGVKIYEIPKCCPNMNCFKPMNMRLLRATLPHIGLSLILSSKASGYQLYDWKTLNKDQTVVNENANKDSDVF